MRCGSAAWPSWCVNVDTKQIRDEELKTPCLLVANKQRAKIPNRPPGGIFLLRPGRRRDTLSEPKCSCLLCHGLPRGPAVARQRSREAFDSMRQRLHDPSTSGQQDNHFKKYQGVFLHLTRSNAYRQRLACLCLSLLCSVAICTNSPSTSDMLSLPMRSRHLARESSFAWHPTPQLGTAQPPTLHARA
jgi:hypothetical protein